MDRNSVIGIIVIAIILIGYSVLMKPSKEEMEAQRLRADSLKQVQTEQLAEQQRELQSKQTKEVTDTVAAVMAAPSQTVTKENMGIFAPRASGKDSFYVLENDRLKLTISNKGGRPYSVQLKQYQTYDSLPLILFSGDSSVFGLQFFSDGRSIATSDLYFDLAEGNDKAYAKDGPVSLAMRLPVDSSGAFIQYTYTLHPDRYFMDIDLRMKGMESHRTDNVQLNWMIKSPQQEKNRVNEQNYSNLYYRYFEGDVEKFKARSKKELQDVNETTKIHWLAYKDQFFSSVLIADKMPFEGGYMGYDRLPEPNKDLARFTAELSLPYDRADDFLMPMHFYFGPNNFKALKRIGFHLQDLVTIGGSVIRWINAWVIIPIFNFLNKFISNYGIIILLLTLIIKLALLPLTFRSYMSQAKMKALKPEIEEINAKIPKDKAMERQQATMALYKKAGVNPMGGCLPMVFQMPILYAMFRFFPTSIELRQQPFLWAHDLSTYDSILNLPFTIPMYGDHVSLFTLLMTVSTILSMRFNSATPGGDSAMPGMKGMMYVMPVMFMLILNNFSAGLTYYYFLANLITLGQNALFKQFVDEDELRRKLYSRKAKATKKSGFQKRIEDMAKQRGYNVPKKK